MYGSHYKNKIWEATSCRGEIQGRPRSRDDLWRISEILGIQHWGLQRKGDYQGIEKIQERGICHGVCEIRFLAQKQPLHSRYVGTGGRWVWQQENDSLSEGCHRCNIRLRRARTDRQGCEVHIRISEYWKKRYIFLHKPYWLGEKERKRRCQAVGRTEVGRHITKGRKQCELPCITHLYGVIPIPRFCKWLYWPWRLLRGDRLSCT